MPRLVLSVLVVLTLAGCATQRVADSRITVEGEVTYRGAEPFAAAWLETDMRTYYVLVLDDAERSALTTPARYRVAGRVYRDSWNGLPMAHLQVETMTRSGR